MTRKLQQCSEQPHLRIKLHLPHFRGRSFQSGNCSIGIDIKNANEAVQRSGGGDDARWVSSNGDNAEAVASVVLLQDELVRHPELHGLVERASEEERRSGFGGRNPCGGPHRFVMSVFDGFQAGEFHGLVGFGFLNKTLENCSFFFGGFGIVLFMHW